MTKSERARLLAEADRLLRLAIATLAPLGGKVAEAIDWAERARRETARLAGKPFEPWDAQPVRGIGRGSKLDRQARAMRQLKNAAKNLRAMDPDAAAAVAKVLGDLEKQQAAAGETANAV